MALTLDELYASPDHYLHSFEGDAAVFMPMDRAAYHRSTFLDHRISPAAQGVMRVPVAALAPVSGKPLATSWIFHLAHGGSTLLARALDNADSNLVLREPMALRQIALTGEIERLDLVRAMIGKRYRAALPSLVKANVPVNFMLPALAAAEPEASAIFLHMPLRAYLLAILRSPDHRAWVRSVTALLAPYLGDLSQASDAERAAALWLGQMRRFEVAISVMPMARSLDSERLFGEPESVVLAAAAHLGIATNAQAIAEIVRGPLFTHHAKRPDVPFDNGQRLARAKELEVAMADEIAVAEAWVGRMGEPIKIQKFL